MISLIIPLRISDIVYDAIPRLENILRNAPPRHFEIVVVDYGSPKNEAMNIEKTCSRFEHARVVRVDNENSPFSAGNARNIGAQHATHDVIMFNDIDCICSAEMYQEIAIEARTRGISFNAYEFFSVPVAFLTFEGTKEYESFLNKNDSNSDKIFYKKIICGDKNSIHFMAYTGSTVVVNKHHYLALGGVSREFHGHGGEDYDIKHRLSAYNPIGTRPLDYYLNTKDNQISYYVGFRSYFALYGIETLYSGLYMVHLWHPKREAKGERVTTGPSYNQTERNFALLKNLMKRFDERGEQPSALPDLSSGEKTLILCRPNSIALESMRHALPLNGDFYVTDEGAFRDSTALLDVISREKFTQIGFLNPYGNEHRLALYNAVRQEGIKFWVFDRGALPSSWFFDHGGFNADSSTYHPDNWNKELDPNERDYVKAYITDLRKGSETLERNGELKSREYWHNKLGVGHRKVLFVPLQRPSDTVTRFFNGNVGPYENFYLWVSVIAASLDSSEWVVVCKKHPLEKTRPSISNVTFAPDDAHIHDLIELSDVVFLMNSGVGVISMAFEKPVIACGDTFYTHDGLAVRANSPEHAVDLIRFPSINSDIVDRFLYHLIKNVYSFGETVYSERTQSDGSTFTAATQIRFESIRGLGRERILGRRRNTVPFNSVLYASFGGAETISRARSSPFVNNKSGDNNLYPKTSKKSPSPIQQACIDYHAKRYLKASELFHQAYKSDKNNINLLRCEAEALLAAGKRDKALERLRLAMEKLPNNKRLARRYRTIKSPWLANLIDSKPFEVPHFN